MRLAGIIQSSGAETKWWEHIEIIRDCEERREGWERRFGVPGCPWGCDGSGVKEIAFHEYAPWEAIPDESEIVLPHGLILTLCECSYYH